MEEGLYLMHGGFSRPHADFDIDEVPLSFLGRTPALMVGYFLLNSEGKIVEKTGELIDPWGTSIILEGHMDKNEFHFLKRYLKNMPCSKEGYDDFIIYDLKREDNIWVGEFKSNRKESEDNFGKATCVTSLVTQFNPSEIRFGGEPIDYLRNKEEYDKFIITARLKSSGLKRYKF